MIRITACILTLSGVLSSAAAQGTWTMDRAHSSITFEVDHMVISRVSGSFKDFTLTFASTKDDLSDAVTEATIQTTSIDTGNERRDRHLRSADFFAADSFPMITFKSSAFEATGTNTYRIRGTMTVKDVTKEVELHAVHNGTVQTRQGKVMGWTVSFQIDRFEFGLKWDRMIETGELVVGKLIDITINAEFRG